MERGRHLFTVPFPRLLPLLILIPALAEAQGGALRPAPSRLFAVTGEARPSRVTRDTLAPVRDDRVPGAVVGGVAGGMIGFLVTQAAFHKEQSSTFLASSTNSGTDDGEVVVTSLVTVGSAALGAWVGYQIGRPSPGDTIPKVGNHGFTGAVIGGVVGGAIGFLAGQDGGGDVTSDEAGVTDGAEVTSEAAFTTIAGAALGAGLGYLAGRSTPKAAHPSNVLPVAPSQDTGVSKWQGGGVGLVSGALLGAAAVSLYATGDQCEDCSTNGENKPYGAGIAIGAVLGMIVGTQWAGAR